MATKKGGKKSAKKGGAKKYTRKGGAGKKTAKKPYSGFGSAYKASN